MLKKLRSSKKGFTLVEMVVAVAILAILAAVLVPTLMGVVGDAQKKADEAQASSIKVVMQTVLLQATINNNGIEFDATDTSNLADSSTDGKISKADITKEFGTQLANGDFDITFVFNDDSDKSPANVKSFTVTYKKVSASSEA